MSLPVRDGNKFKKFTDNVKCKYDKISQRLIYVNYQIS